MKVLRARFMVAAICVAAAPALLMVHAKGSDHADTPQIAASPGVDLTDVFMFPSPTTAQNVVLVMNVHPLIPSGMGASAVFDPNVLYQFKIDNVGDNVEHLVIQAKFSGTGANQIVQIAGPVAPSMTGTQTVFMPPNSGKGTINQAFTSNGMKIFCGAREDPFFFDLDQFFKILPDRSTPLFPANAPPAGQENTPMQASFRPAGSAVDFLKGFNVLSIVVEVPNSMLTTSTRSKIGLWCTTSK